MTNIFDTYSNYPSMINEEIEGLSQTVKNLGLMLHSFMDKIDNREMALAKTNLQQSIFWALRGIIEVNVRAEKERQKKMREGYVQVCTPNGMEAPPFSETK